MDKQIFEETFLKQGRATIELGCGPYKQDPKNIAIDIIQLDGVDIVADLNEGLSFIPDNSIEKITSRHVLEHIAEIHLLIREIHRVLVPGGVHEAIVPHHSNPFYYSDLTHEQFFGLYSFDYFGTEETMLKRKVPAFYNDIKFDIVDRKLQFRSKFWLVQLFKRTFTRFVNISNGTKEFYEGVLSRSISCYEIHFKMKKKA